MSAVLLGPCLPGPPAPRPLLLSSVSAGFPSPADDYVEAQLDLNDHIGGSDPGTFFLRCAGDSMTGAGISPGDLLVVRKGVEARSGDVVIAELDGEFTVKRWLRRGRRAWLVPDSDHYAPIEVQPGHEMVVWGVVTHSLRMHRDL